MQLRPFRIEQYYAEREFTARYMLSSSDCESRTVGELLELQSGAEDALRGLWCGYTESPGAPALRAELAAGYDGLEPDDVLVTSCAEEGIFLVCHAPLRPGDHAVRTRSWPGSWRSPAVAGRRCSATRCTATWSTSRRCGCPRPARRTSARSRWAARPRALGLPGLRLGWLASRDRDLLASVLDLKHYTTICSSAPSELLSTLALRHRRTLLDRNLEIVRGSLELLDDLFERRDDLFAWVRPSAGPIGFPRIAGDVGVEQLCASLVASAGVLLLPGAVYDEPAPRPRRLRPPKHAGGAGPAGGLPGVTLDDVRSFALSLPEATEAPHHERTSFRLRGKIFATALPGANSCNVLLDEPEARAAVFEDANVFGELWWGKWLVGVKVDLAAAEPDRVEELVTEAWLRRAPNALAERLDRRGS